MPRELLRIDHPVTWLRTIIRRRTFGVETEFHFNNDGEVLSVAIGRIVESDFLYEAMQVDCIKILEYSNEERGWTENDAAEIVINFDDDVARAATRGPFVRFGNVEPNTAA